MYKTGPQQKFSLIMSVLIFFAINSFYFRFFRYIAEEKRYQNLKNLFWNFSFWNKIWIFSLRVAKDPLQSGNNSKYLSSFCYMLHPNTKISLWHTFSSTRRLKYAVCPLDWLYNGDKCTVGSLYCIMDTLSQVSYPCVYYIM